jgi:hypothetical protein
MVFIDIISILNPNNKIFQSEYVLVNPAHLPCPPPPTHVTNPLRGKNPRKKLGGRGAKIIVEYFEKGWEGWRGNRSPLTPPPILPRFPQFVGEGECHPLPCLSHVSPVVCCISPRVGVCVFLTIHISCITPFSPLQTPHSPGWGKMLMLWLLLPTSWWYEVFSPVRAGPGGGGNFLQISSHFWKTGKYRSRKSLLTFMINITAMICHWVLFCALSYVFLSFKLSTVIQQLVQFSQYLWQNSAWVHIFYWK